MSRTAIRSPAGSAIGLPSLATTPSDGGRLAAETLPWLAVLAIVVIALWLAAVWLKRRLGTGGATPAAGFDAEELERLRRDGALTDEQYRAISRSMVRRVSGLSSSPNGHAEASDGPERPDVSDRKASRERSE